MRVIRCPRCLAQDITADAHPSRRFVDGRALPYFVCRGCFRAAELEFRITCEGANLVYERLAIRESLRMLRDFYRLRLADSPENARVSSALADVERRLGIAPLGRAPKLDV
ncbi:MAG TPA: hypothetical protein VGR87_02070 [Candidatus Limnocylindria bacterium]|nr:hypothetical protein [Candidatus Limnocylindria bacterium]